MTTLVSFDIDGTLESGDPRGSVAIEFVRKLKEQGILVGSCSVRPKVYQLQMWESCGIEVDFAVMKECLDHVRSMFPADYYYHVGDTDVDTYVANQAGFHFIRVDSLRYHQWREQILSLSG